MSDSEAEVDVGLPPPPKRRKFAFKKLAQRIAAVDVDVYRQLKTVRPEPLDGTTSFFQEELQKWRELNTAEHFLRAAGALNGITQTFPLLLHHKDDIVAILLEGICLEAALSLEPLLVLLGTLARDLQADFLAYVPRIFLHLSSMVGQGAHAEPELLQHIFNCLALICKNVVKQLAADLPQLLRNSSRLRYHAAPHVRRLAAATLAYILRHATSLQLRTAVRTVLAEHAMQPSEHRTDGAGLLLAETAKGVSHGLHSKAPYLFSLLFKLDLLLASDFKSGRKAISQEDLRIRAYQISESMLAHLLEHLRRGKVEALWDAVMLAADRDVTVLEAHGGQDPAVQAQAARAVSRVAQMTEFHRGSRVEDYSPLFEVAARICATQLLTGAVASPSAKVSAGADFVKQALRLLIAILAGHGQVVGASQGASAIRAHQSDWSSAFDLVPGELLLPFLKSLLVRPSGSEAVAAIFATQGMTALARILLGEGESEATKNLALPLLAEWCQALNPQGPSLAGKPFLKSFPRGEELAVYLKALARGDELSIAGHARESAVAACAKAYGATQCLQYACTAEELGEACAALLAITQQMLKEANSEVSAALLVVHTAALELRVLACAQLMGQKAEAYDTSPKEIQTLADDTLRLVKQHPTEYNVVQVAANALTLASRAGNQHDLDELQDLLPYVEPNLADNSQAMRRETLRLLLAFAQPAVPGSGDVLAQSDIFSRLLKIESMPPTLDSGRAAAVAVEGLKAAVEFGKVPAMLIGALVRSLMGVLNVKFSLIWGPSSEALALTLQQRPRETWPLFVGRLAAVQQAFLAGAERGILPGKCSKGLESVLVGWATLLSADLGADLYRQLLVVEEGSASTGQSLEERFAGALSAGSPELSGGLTDASVRLNHLLKALSRAPTGLLEKHAREWVPLFLSYIAAKGSGSDEAEIAKVAQEQDQEDGRELEDAQPSTSGRGSEGVSIVSNIGGRAWRAHLKDWLSVVAAVRAPKNLYDSQRIRLAVAMQLTDLDPGVQQAALNCLKPWKLKYLNEHLDNISRLASDSTLREELTAFPLAKSASGSIEEQHRPGLIAVLVRVLWPKMRKRSGRLAGKGAPGSARSAILNFLAAAEPRELAPLISLFMQPLGSALKRPAELAAEDSSASPDKLFEDPWWTAHLGQQPADWWLGVPDRNSLSALPLRVKLGFLNATGDLLQHLGHRLQPYLTEMTSLLVAFLETAPISQAGAPRAEGSEGAREIRSTALRMLASIWSQFPGGMDHNPLWPRFFALAEPLMQRLPIEACSLQVPALYLKAPSMQASADRAPPLLEVLLAFASSLHLLPLLADKPSAVGPVSDSMSTALLTQTARNQWAIKMHSGSRLLGQAVNVLGASTCAQPAREMGLSIIELILEYGDATAAVILQPHISCLLEALRGIALAGSSLSTSTKRSKAAAAKGTASKQPSGKRVALRSLAILERLSVFSSTADMSDKLVDALLPMLLQKAGTRKGRARSEEVMLVRVLNVLAAVWKRQAQGEVTPGVQEKLLGIADALAPLAGNLEGHQPGRALSAAFQALASILPFLGCASKLFSGLTAMSSTQIEEVDYDARLAAYRQLLPAIWTEVAVLGGAAVLLQRCFQDLRNAGDLALRHAAAQALARFVEAAAGGQDPEHAPTKEHLVMKVVYPCVKKSIAAANLAVRQEHLTLLRSLCICFPEKFAEMRVLADTDMEIDFFANVAHLQMYRRIRALQRLTKMVKGRSLGPGALLGLVMPLLAQIICEGRSGEGAGHDLKDIDRDRDVMNSLSREANVVDAAVRALGDVAAHLEWPHYQQLLGHFLRAMHRQGDNNKAVVRSVCTIIDAFHFQVATATESSLPASGAPASLEEAARLVPDQEEAVGGSAVVPDEQASKDILSSLTKRVLPTLQSALVVKSGETVRAPVALALVKLLRLLPPAATRATLPKVLQGVSNLLRNRLQRIRDDARIVLAAMVAELGPKYLPFVLDVLQSALPEKGYMAHIRGYTLHFLLEAINKDLHPGSLDEALPSILPMITSQLFGLVAEEKEAGVFAGTREAKKLRAYDTFQMLAQGITFRTQLANLLAPVKARLQEAGDPAVRAKLARLLEAAQKGLASNSTATAEDVLIFVSGVMETVVPAEAAAIKRAEAASKAASRGEVEEGQLEVEDAARHQHLLLEFALSLVQRGLKKGTLGGRSPQMLAMLDPLLPLLVAALKSRHSAVVELSLRIFSNLVQLPLPGLESAAPGAGEAMAELLRKSPSTTTRIAQECLWLLASLLRTCPEWAPTTQQLRFLITWGLSDVEEAAAHVAAFRLLRGVIKRRLLLPEVYDVMSNVQDLMIRSQATAVRQLCSSTLLQFLLDYPVGEKRFKQHMHFLVANLSYEHETGRIAAIDLMKVLITKLPPQILRTWAPIFFLPLVTRLVNDPSARCRSEVGDALSTLLKAVRPTQVDAFATYCAQWLGGEDVRLRRAAAQTYGLIAEVEDARFGRRVNALLPALTAVVTRHAAEADAANSDLQGAEEQEGNGQQTWQETYYTLLLLIIIMKQCPKELRWVEGSTAVHLWRALPDLVLHRHLWVRKLTADLLGLAFANEGIWQGLLKCQEGSPARLSALFYQQLEATAAQDASLAQSAKCLIFLSLHLYTVDEAAGRLPSQQAPLVDQGDDAGEEDEEEDGGEDEAEQGQGLSLYGLVRRMARLADDRTFPRQLARLNALRFLAALTTRLGTERVGPFLPTILRPLFRVTEGLSPNPPEVKELAEEVVAHIRKVAGSDALLGAFNAARQSVTSARAERKRQQALQAMLDPAATARSKLQKQARRLAGRKRQIDEMARLRGAGLPVKNKKPRKKALE